MKSEVPGLGILKGARDALRKLRGPGENCGGVNVLTLKPTVAGLLLS